jgi:hypothetical protein
MGSSPSALSRPGLLASLRPGPPPARAFPPPSSLASTASPYTPFPYRLTVELASSCASPPPTRTFSLPLSPRWLFPLHCPVTLPSGPVPSSGIVTCLGHASRLRVSSRPPDASSRDSGCGSALDPPVTPPCPGPHAPPTHPTIEHAVPVLRGPRLHRFGRRLSCVFHYGVHCARERAEQEVRLEPGRAAGQVWRSARLYS